MSRYNITFKCRIYHYNTPPPHPPIIVCPTLNSQYTFYTPALTLVLRTTIQCYGKVYLSPNLKSSKLESFFSQGECEMVKIDGNSPLGKFDI